MGGRHDISAQPHNRTTAQPHSRTITFRKIPFLHISCIHMELPISTGVAVLFRRPVFAFYGV
jgi:hypothetical protein